jgi:hypothetical protein
LPQRSPTGYQTLQAEYWKRTWPIGTGQRQLYMCV